VSTFLLKLEPLCQETFYEFGDVIDDSKEREINKINYGHTLKIRSDSVVDTHRKNGKTVINLYKTRPIKLPFEVKKMERHPIGTQAFINIDDNPAIAIVAKKGKFDATELRAFLVRSDQAINYHKGTWHHHNLCLDRSTRFIVVERDGPEANCEEIDIPQNIKVVVDF
tara:strand:- start:3065 stop:3568 length:504 start_codon:yes stop_codon:yes gene_type:complete